MEAHFDEYEHWNFDHDKHIYSGKSGKGRTSREASQNTNRSDPSGHTRKALTKLLNNHHKHDKQRRTVVRRQQRYVDEPSVLEQDYKSANQQTV